MSVEKPPIMKGRRGGEKPLIFANLSLMGSQREVGLDLGASASGNGGKSGCAEKNYPRPASLAFISED